MRKNTSKQISLSTAKPSFVTQQPNASSSKKADKNPIVLGSKGNILLSAIYLMVFVAVAAYLTFYKNVDTLYNAQDRGFFSSDFTWLKECMRQPGGLLIYASSYLTQYFYTPAVGITMLIALWVLSYVLSHFAFRLKGQNGFFALIPLSCLLTMVVFTGYWFYYLKSMGYWFGPTLGYLLMVITQLVALPMNSTVRKIFAVVWAAALYPACGFYALMAGVWTLVCAFFFAPAEADKSHSSDAVATSKPSRTSELATSAIALLAILVIPAIYYRFYTAISYPMAWMASIPMFTADNAISYHKYTPFIIMALSPAFMIIGSRMSNTLNMKYFASAGFVMAFAVALPLMNNFDNYNFHAELRMYNAAEQQQWDEVLTEAANAPGKPTRQMVILKNLALLNNGTIGNQMFHYDNSGADPYVDDSLKVHMVQTAAPLIYYNHGKVNFALRWNIENGVEYGFRFHDIRSLLRCSIINGEWDSARKYIAVLKTSTFQKEYAERCEELVNHPEKIDSYHEFDNVRELYKHMGTTLDGDNGLCEMYLLNYFSNTHNKDSKLLQELTLDYALIQKDIQLFWPKFFLYASLHQGDEMPIHYQEAAFLYGNLEHEVDITSMPFDKQKIIERYASFNQMSQQLLASKMTVEQVGEAMRSNFGDTFWWFYFFCRDVHSY